MEATLNESVILAKGAVVRTADVKGRRVSLEVSIDNGRLGGRADTHTCNAIRNRDGMNGDGRELPGIASQRRH